MREGEREREREGGDQKLGNIATEGRNGPHDGH